MEYSCGIVKSITHGQKIFCGEPAAFRYYGLVKVNPGENFQLALKLRGRQVVDLCLEHTREMILTMEPVLHSGEASLKCLVQDKLTIVCKECQSLFRLEPIPPTMYRAPGHYCPNCGSKDTLSTRDHELDFWELLSARLGDLSPGLTQQIYNLWLEDKKASPKFVTYVLEIMAELH